MKMPSYEAPRHSFLQRLTVSSVSSPSILLGSVFSDTLIPCFSLDVRALDLHPYRTTSKITVVYFNIYIFREQMRRQTFLNKYYLKIQLLPPL
jgi:hypothetical protein